MTTPTGAPVKYPAIMAGERPFVLCWGPGARYQIQHWGYWLDGKPIPLLALAAAMAGNLNHAGTFKSARFEHPTELAELMGPDQSELEYAEAISAALKNIAPGATLTLSESPARTQEGTDIAA